MQAVDRVNVLRMGDNRASGINEYIVGDSGQDVLIPVLLVMPRNPVATTVPCHRVEIELRIARQGKCEAVDFSGNFKRSLRVCVE